MAKKEIRIPYDELGDSQTITERNKEIFERHGFDIHRHESDHEDDDGRQERILRIKKPTKYFY